MDGLAGVRSNGRSSHPLGSAPAVTPAAPLATAVVAGVAHSTDAPGGPDLEPRERGLSPLARRAYREIKAMILASRLPAGASLLEDDLVRAVGASRTPIREALVLLQGEGLIEIVPRRGIRVVPLSVDDIREVYDLLTLLESEAASLLAGRADRADRLVALAARVETMRAALQGDDLDAWARANDAFHHELVAASGNRRLASICGNLLDQSQRVRAYTLRMRRKPVATTRLHEAMLRAIGRGDAARAAAIQARNKRAFQRQLEDIFERTRLQHI